MIRTPYNSQVVPPAPFVLIDLTDPVGGASVVGRPAQIDSAADRTLVPLRLAEALGLVPIDHIEIGGVGGHVDTYPVFLVMLAIQTLPSRPVRVVAHPDESWVLLGLDVLSGHRVVLDGPNLILEIT